MPLGFTFSFPCKQTSLDAVSLFIAGADGAGLEVSPSLTRPFWCRERFPRHSGLIWLSVMPSASFQDPSLLILYHLPHPPLLEHKTVPVMLEEPQVPPCVTGGGVAREGAPERHELMWNLGI